MKVYVFGIKYDKKCSTISVTGCDALRNWMEPKYLEYYGKHYADRTDWTNGRTEMWIEAPLSNNWLDDLDDTEYKIKKVIENITGLTVISFNYRVAE